MLTRQQFDILAYLATHRNVSLPQRKLAQVLGKSRQTSRIFSGGFWIALDSDYF